jgi:IS30 family transposase
MRISHEAIYQALFIQGWGALKRELVACLRTGRARRVPRARVRQRRDGMVTPEVMISVRPAQVDDRAVPGHWEGDPIIGLDGSAIGTLVERTTRFTMLLHLPRMEGYGVESRVKNGPALAGHGAEAVRDAIAATITTLPDQLRRTLTWDRGKELAQHATLTIDTGVQVYFADQHSPWQRGTNENTNGLLRQYFPKGTDLARWNRDDLDAVAATLNSRPRKTLGWKTPAEALNEHYSPFKTSVLRRPVESGNYTSFRFSQRLADNGILASMGSTGDSYDNALMENFWSTLKIELVYRTAWRTRDEAENALFAYIDTGTTPGVSRRTSATSALPSTRPPGGQPTSINPSQLPWSRSQPAPGRSPSEKAGGTQRRPTGRSPGQLPWSTPRGR